jgi:hypothetical protein
LGSGFVVGTGARRLRVFITAIKILIVMSNGPPDKRPYGLVWIREQR